MRKAYKNLISLFVILIAGLNFIIPAYAQDPFSAIAIGGTNGLSSFGLFNSMASASGIDIGYVSDPVNDAMWNKLNPDSVYFSGVKHQATGIGEDIYDYIDVDIGDWLDAQSDFIVNYIQENNIQDNDSGTTSTDANVDGIPLGSIIAEINIGDSPTSGSYTLGNNLFGVNFAISGWTMSGYFIYKGQTFGNFSGYGRYSGLVRLSLSANGNQLLFQNPAYSMTITGTLPSHTTTPSSTVPYTSNILNTGVFDDYGSAKVKLEYGFLSPGWTIEDFLNGLNNKIASGHGEDIIIQDGTQPEPPPPVPIPDTPLGDVGFDDWVDLWGQSIWEQLTRLEEKQELMVIGQEDGLESLEDLQGIGHDLIEDVDDLIGLETDINENLEDMITYEQGISEDVEDIGENVEDIEDEVIIIVDEMGNVIDVLEGIDAKLYAQGQQLGSISTEVGTAADAAEAIQTEVEAQTDIQEDIKDTVEDMVPYVAPIPDIASDTETIVDILPDIATATETTTETLTDTLPDIKDATQTISDTLPDIITEIQDATTTLTDDIPNIDDICLNIDEAPYKDIDTGLDRLPRFLLPFITDLRSALGIWHYVTEWLAQISTTFAFISGCLVGTSIMTPIYAAIAGFMCIKVYRRMTS